MRKGSKAFTGVGHLLGRLETAPVDMQNGVTKKPPNYSIPKKKSQNVGGSAQRIEPRAAPIRTAAADAVVDAVQPAYVEQAQARSHAARREKEAQRAAPLIAGNAKLRAL